MGLTEIIRSHGKLVKISVPSRLQKKLGDSAVGTLLTTRRDGKLLRVTVEVSGHKYEFRPQDLSRTRQQVA